MMAKPDHPVASQRRARGWTQSEVAKRAGISRAAVSAVENCSVVPSVEVALALARVFEVTVEKLFGRGQRQADPVRVVGASATAGGWWEVRDEEGVLRYPCEGIAMNPFPPDGFTDGCHWKGREGNPPPTLTVACCDPAARWLGAEYERFSGVRLLVLQRNGSQALELLKAGDVHLGGIHASCPGDPEANVRRVRDSLGRGWMLLRVADWVSGVALPAGEKPRPVATLARGGRKWAMREKGAAARESLDQLLGSHRPAGRVVTSHQAVADSVMAGWADAGITLQLCANEDRLGFVPIRSEGFDLVFAERRLDDPRLRKLIALLQSRSHRQAVASLPGYSSRQTGSLVTS